MKILLFTSPTCAWCPYVAELLEKIIQETSDINLELDLVDITKNIELAEKHEIVAVPTIVLPTGQRLVGVLDAKEIKRYIASFLFNSTNFNI